MALVDPSSQSSKLQVKALKKRLFLNRQAWVIHLMREEFWAARKSVVVRFDLR
jgi:hypothetical protein